VFKEATASSHSTSGVPACAHHGPGRIGWAQLKRVFHVYLKHCSNCVALLKIIDAITVATVIEGILNHLHLAAQGPPRSPEQLPDLLQAA